MQSRRSIAERVIARARARGAAIDGDLEYMALVELWIEGEIDIQEMRRRYTDLLTTRAANRRKMAEINPPPPQNATDSRSTEVAVEMVRPITGVFPADGE